MHDTLDSPLHIYKQRAIKHLPSEHQAFIRLPAEAAANAPGVAATAPVPDVGGELPAYSTAGLVAQVWMTNWPVAVVPPVPETPPADPPTGLEELSPKPSPTVGNALYRGLTNHCTNSHAVLAQVVMGFFAQVVMLCFAQIGMLCFAQVAMLCFVRKAMPFIA